LEFIHLWRSYDHERPPRRTLDAHNRAEEALPNQYGPADRTQIYKVARATSAAPGFFEPILIDGSPHLDGAIRANNPSLQVIDEVLDKEDSRVPALALSIGTGKKSQENHTQRRATDLSRGNGGYRLTRWETIKYHLSSLLVRPMQQMTETERTVKSWEKKCSDIQGGRTANQWWYRLNVDNELGDVKLDQWVPRKGGGSTLSDITKYTMAYLEKEEVTNAVRKIAETLVDKRRKRVRTERWERFAMDVVYQCHDHHLEVDTRKGMLAHFETEAEHKPKKPWTPREMHEKLNEKRIVIRPY